MQAVGGAGVALHGGLRMDFPALGQTAGFSRGGT